MSVRLSKEMAARLEAAAESLKQKKHTVARLAIEAAVEAIEASGGSLVIPLKFDVAQVPVPKTGTAASPPGASTTGAQEGAPKKKKAA